MSKKTDSVQKLIDSVSQRWPVPEPPVPGETLLEKGIVLVLTRHMPQAAAEMALAALKKVFDDWNEVRVSQAQEIAAHIRPGGKGGKAGGKASLEAANALKAYLQEVFQRTHGMTLSELVEDPAAAAKHVLQMPFLGVAGASYLLFLAGDGAIPIHGGLVRVLDRYGLIRRAGSGKKGRELIEPLIPPGKELDFLLAISEVADRWCDSRRPLCHECPLVAGCVHGRKALKEWQALQARLEVQRNREEARRAVEEKKEAARRAREEARARKKAEADAKKRARELERKRKADEREREKLRRQGAKREASQKASQRASQKASQQKAAQKAASRKAANTVRPAARPKTATVARKGGQASRRTTKKPGAKPTTPPTKSRRVTRRR